MYEFEFEQNLIEVISKCEYIAAHVIDDYESRKYTLVTMINRDYIEFDPEIILSMDTMGVMIRPNLTPGSVIIYFNSYYKDVVYEAEIHFFNQAVRKLIKHVANRG